MKHAKLLSDYSCEWQHEGKQLFRPPSGGNINRRRSYWIWSNQKISYSWAEERKTKKTWTTMSQDLNKTMNGTQPLSCYWNRYSNKRSATTFAYCLIFLVALVGNTVIGIIVYKTKTMRKPINFLIVNMAMSDLLVPIFLIPWDIHMALHKLLADRWSPWHRPYVSWQIFLPSASILVSIQSLVLIAVDRFWSCGISPSFSTYQLKTVPFLYARHLDHRDGFLFPMSPRLQTCGISRRVAVRAALERSLWRILILWKITTVSIVMIFILIPLVSIAILYHYPFI